jgi:hypothetical protein
MMKTKILSLRYLTLVVCAGLLIYGLPFFWAEVTMVPGNPVYDQISAGRPVSDQDLETLVGSRMEALKVTDLPRASSELSTAYLIQSQRSGDTLERHRLALLATEAAVRHNDIKPLSTFDWLKVASAALILGSDYHRAGVDAWRSSVATSRFEPFIIIKRIHVGIMFFSQFSAEDIMLLKEQIRLAYEWDRSRFWHYMDEQKLRPWIAFLSEPDSEIKKIFEKP